MMFFAAPYILAGIGVAALVVLLLAIGIIVVVCKM